MLEEACVSLSKFVCAKLFVICDRRIWNQYLRVLCVLWYLPLFSPLSHPHSKKTRKKSWNHADGDGRQRGRTGQNDERSYRRPRALLQIWPSERCIFYFFNSILQRFHNILSSTSNLLWHILNSNNNSHGRLELPRECPSIWQIIMRSATTLTKYESKFWSETHSHANKHIKMFISRVRFWCFIEKLFSGWQTEVAVPPKSWRHLRQDPTRPKLGTISFLPTFFFVFLHPFCT